MCHQDTAPNLSELIPFSEIPDVLPRRKGKKINVCLPYRWAQRGIGGIRLRYVKVGGVMHTHPSWLWQFFFRDSGLATPSNGADPALTTSANPTRTAAQARRSKETAAREMAEAGLA